MGVNSRLDMLFDEMQVFTMTRWYQRETQQIKKRY